jgi:hypothetical protein
MRLPHRWILASVLAAVVAGCGSAGPTTLQKSASPPATGTHRVTCNVDSDHGRVLFAIDLPRGFVSGPPDFDDTYGKLDGCAWHHPVRIPDDSNFDGDPTTADTYQSNVVVTVGSVRKGGSLQDVYDDQEPSAVDGDKAEGDDSILHLELRKDVKVFGDTVGDRLSYLCFCDGQNLISRYAQADGIRLTWSADQPIQRATDRQLEDVLGSAGKVTPRD